MNPDRVCGPEEPPQTLLLSPPTTDPGLGAAAHRTPLSVLPGSVAYIPAHCPSLIPVLLPQQQGGAPYTIYLQSPSAKRSPLTRPQPTSFAVRSMTFEERTGQSPGPGPLQGGRRTDISPLVQKRVGSDSTCESSPPKARRTGTISKVRSWNRSKPAWMSLLSFPERARPPLPPPGLSSPAEPGPPGSPQVRRWWCSALQPSLLPSPPPGPGVHQHPRRRWSGGQPGAGTEPGGLPGAGGQGGAGSDARPGGSPHASADAGGGECPLQAAPGPRGLLGLERVCSASRLWSRLDSTSPFPPQKREKFQTWEKRTRPRPRAQVKVLRWSLGGGSESKLSWTVVLSPRVQTPPSPGDDPHQRPPPQTPLCCHRLPSRRPQGPAAPPQPQPRHPQLHPAEPGPDLPFRPRRRTGCLPGS